MKATFFSIAALAAGAIASPIANGPVEGQVPQGLTRDVEVVDKFGLEQIFNAPTNAVKVTRDAAPPKTISSESDLLSKLNATVSSIHPHIDNVKSIVSKVKSGDMTKDAGADAVKEQFSVMRSQLTDLNSQLKGVSRLPVTRGFFGDAIALVVGLFNDLVLAAESVVGLFSGSVGVSSAVLAVSELVGELLTLLTSLVVGLVPGLVSVLTAGLAGLGTGVLAVVSPVSDVVTTLKAAHNV